MVPFAEIIRLRHEELLFLEWIKLLIVVNPAKAMRAISNIIKILVFVARLVLVAPAKTEISKTITSAWEMVIANYPPKFRNYICFAVKKCENCKKSCVFDTKEI